MHKTTKRRFCYYLIGLIFFAFATKVEAQVVIGAPSLQFTQACASETFNTFQISFVFSPESALNSDNQFVVELSNATGDFSNATTVFTSAPGAVTISPAILNFSLPTTTAGEGYKVRVKSTSPAATSSPSPSFPAYYKLHDSPFTINNLVQSGSYCPGGSYMLTIDNPGMGGGISPLNFPTLTFNWYKETGPTTSVFISEGLSLTVSSEGTYFAETNYGTCTSNSYSNRVSVTEATTGQTATTTIVSSLGNPYCSTEGPTTLSTTAGDSYIWYKEGSVIQGANSMTYITNEAGNYSVEVISGSCTAIATIALETEDLMSSIDVPAVNMMEAGETLVVTITTTALDPSFEWYLNEELIAGANSNSYNATQFGNYRVIVSQNSGCQTSDEFLFEIREQIDPFPEVANIPNIVSPNGDGINDTWIIPTQYVSGSNTQVTIYSSQGEVVHKTNDYQNDWPQDQPNLGSVNNVYYYILESPDQEIKKGTITLIK
tara:strand:+ start:98220 stop:99686 length:1467 start_codon:yes stop_codon:yes gene_type:complete